MTGVIEISFSALLLSSSYTRILLINDALSLLPPSHSLLFISIVVLDVAASLEVASQSVRHRPNDEVAASQKNSSYFTSIASYLPHSLTSASCFSWTFCLTWNKYGAFENDGKFKNFLFYFYIILISRLDWIDMLRMCVVIYVDVNTEIFVVVRSKKVNISWLRVPPPLNNFFSIQIPSYLWSPVSGELEGN